MVSISAQSREERHNGSDVFNSRHMPCSALALLLPTEEAECAAAHSLALLRLGTDTFCHAPRWYLCSSAAFWLLQNLSHHMTGLNLNRPNCKTAGAVRKGSKPILVIL